MSAKRRLVVVGNGMAGARLLESLVARGGRDRFDLCVFGDEPHGNYNRVLLSSVLAGSQRREDIFINPVSWYAEHGIRLHAGIRVERIDRSRNAIITQGGLAEPYDDLVIATGSHPFIPPIAGIRDEAGRLKAGVFLFRTLQDCDRMLAAVGERTRIAVVGGGLLGLEAAKGLRGRGADVEIVHVASHLMEAQLDVTAGGVLASQIRRMGLQVRLNAVTAAVVGDERIRGIRLADQSVIDCEMVVIAAGIRPNTSLAADAGLLVDRGILVGDDLACTGTTDVYAIGECAEHRGRVYGLVAPVWEQADVLADRLASGRPHASYHGSKLSTKLKVAGVDLAVMGDKEPVEDDDEVVSYAEPARGVYKKLIVRNDRVAGAIVIGDTLLVPALVQAFVDARRVAENRAEILFPVGIDTRVPDPEAIPDSTRICDCNAVTKARIVEAVLEGARSVRAVSDATRACTGCGTCRPEVERIIEFACRGQATPELLAEAPGVAEPPLVPAAGRDGQMVVTLNKVERIKKEKDGLDVLDDVPRMARDGWRSIEEADRERLKWTGVFFRRQTPGLFMMRVRIPNGLANAAQIRVLAEISREVGAGFVDLTTRQQVQLRGLGIEHVPAFWERLAVVGLGTLQTGMDNVRNVIGCPMAGLTPREIVDASPIARQFTEMFLGNREFTNLPRKFNVAVTGCLDHCVHTASQDLALTPAWRTEAGHEVAGFNVSVGGKVGSGGYRAATPLDVFVRPDEAAALCAHITRLFRDHGQRGARNRARLAFLIDTWGIDQFRRELQRRIGKPLTGAGADAGDSRTSDHLGIVRQKQPGLNAVGLVIPVGRITISQLIDLARIAETCGSGEIRITTGQNVIVPNVPDDRLATLLSDPLLRELSCDPPAVVRGLVSCTGIDYCHLALVETKQLALEVSSRLAAVLPHDRPLTMHWSGCPAGCGNHTGADIGLLGKNIRVGGEIVEAVDVFLGGKSGPDARPGAKILEDVPCKDLPHVLERVIPFLSPKRRVRPVFPSAAPPPRASDGQHADA